MYSISKVFDFSAAHRLPHLRQGHPCGRAHGHNYKVEVTIQSEILNLDQFIVDYGDLTQFEQFIKAQLDHYDLNEVVAAFVLPDQESDVQAIRWYPGHHTTAENLAEWLWRVANFYLRKHLDLLHAKPPLREFFTPKLIVRVKETDKTSAEYWQ
jgi:queuosine biosynthesis protein QueD